MGVGGGGGGGGPKGHKSIKSIPKNLPHTLMISVLRNFDHHYLSNGS